MISIIEVIDGFLLEEVFQKFSDFFQMAIGKTCFFLAKIAVMLAFVSWVISVISIPPDDIYFLILISLFTLDFAYDAWQFTVKADRLEQQVNEGKQMKNAAALVLFPLRIGSLLILVSSLIGTFLLRGHEGWVLGIGSAYLDAFAMFVVIWIYFLSCTPLPPGESKVKQWLRGWATAPVPSK